MLSVLALGEADIAVAIGIEGPGGIDGAAIGREPGTHLLHTFKSLGGQVALRVGADIEKEVTALGHDVSKHVDELGSALVVVGGDVGPAVAHGHAGLPRVGQQGVRHLFLGGAVVLVAATHGAVNNDKVGVVGTGNGGEGVHVDVLHALAAS